MREKPIETYLIEQWEARTGGMCVKFPPLFYAGFPDRICLAWPAVIVFVETKATFKFSAKLQTKIQNRLRGLGFPVEEIDTREKVDDFINRYDNTII